MLYDSEGDLLSETSGIAGSNANVATTSFGYDNLYRLTQEIDAYGTAIQRTLTFVYDNMGNEIESIDGRGTITSIGYDALNRPTQIDYAFGTSVQHSATMIYDPAGNLLSETTGIASTNPQLLTTSFGYDRADRLTTEIDAYGVSGLQQTLTTVYDKVGNVVNTIDGLGHKTTYVFDALNRAIRMFDPRNALTTTLFDATDNVVTVVDPVGNTSTFQYDVLNRTTQETDPLNHNSTFAYDARDNLTSATDRSSMASFVNRRTLHAVRFFPIAGRYNRQSFTSRATAPGSFLCYGCHRPWLHQPALAGQNRPDSPAGTRRLHSPCAVRPRNSSVPFVGPSRVGIAFRRTVLGGASSTPGQPQTNASLASLVGNNAAATSGANQRLQVTTA